MYMVRDLPENESMVKPPVSYVTEKKLTVIKEAKTYHFIAL